MMKPGCLMRLAAIFDQLGRLGHAMGAGLRALLLSLRAWVLFLVGLIVLLVIYYCLSDRYTPFTSDAYVQAYVIQMAAQVEGRVTRVAVHENQRVEKGELLFEIDRRPFEHRVRQLEAKLTYATKQIEQMESDLAAARADAAKAAADEAFALAVFQQETVIFKQDSTTERKYLDALQKHKAAQAVTQRTQALIRQREQGLAALLGDEHALVAEVRAQLATARLDLDWTRVHAPASGFITNLQLREGSYVHVGQPVLTCIDGETFWIVANFRENCLERLAAGQTAEISFNTYPGRVWSTRVESVGWGVNQGQGVPSGLLPEVENLQTWIRPAQRFQVRLAVPDSADLQFRVGASAAVTVYTTPDYWLNPLAEFWQRVVAWFDYLY